MVFAMRFSALFCFIVLMCVPLVAGAQSPVPSTNPWYQGRTIGQVRLSVQAAADKIYNTQAYVSLASVRQIGVLIVGHVNKPGRKNLTVFHTVVDALMQAEGIQKTGSFRQVKLVRDGRSTIIDLYGLLMHGALGNDLRLKDGDRIIVPSIGPTVAIGGEVKRPGIYETPQVIMGRIYTSEDRSRKLSLGEMLDLAGGILSPGKNRFLKMGSMIGSCRMGMWCICFRRRKLRV